MEGLIIPEGSGGEEPPEEAQMALWDERAKAQQEKRMIAFENNLNYVRARTRKRRDAFHDYTTKNCEEACGERWSP